MDSAMDPALLGTAQPIWLALEPVARAESCSIADQLWNLEKSLSSFELKASAMGLLAATSPSLSGLCFSVERDSSHTGLTQSLQPTQGLGLGALLLVPLPTGPGVWALRPAGGPPASGGLRGRRLWGTGKISSLTFSDTLARSSVASSSEQCSVLVPSMDRIWSPACRAPLLSR
jgi:hypothetical protein